MLAAYETQTRRLLQNPAASTTLYIKSDIDAWINLARSQLAGEGECVRNYATLQLTAGTNKYNFTDIVLSAPSTGVQGVFNIRQSLVGLGGGNESVDSFFEHPVMASITTANVTAKNIGRRFMLRGSFSNCIPKAYPPGAPSSSLGYDRFGRPV